MNYPKVVLWSGVIAAFCLSGSALAQTETTNNSASTQNPTATSDTPASDQTTQKLGTIVVSGGLRASQKQSVLEKRIAPQIQDSITATDIGALPDATITDSLQRIPGVQIDRSAGEGSAMNIRGLPQVGTTINGGVFLPAGNIVSNQPSFTDVPAALMSGADVIKSPTASLFGSGISGTVNLNTWRPFDLKDGVTVSGTLDVTHGNYSDETEPELNALYGYNSGNQWGFVVSLAYSDVTHENSYKGSAWSPQFIHGEAWNSDVWNADANPPTFNSGGFIGAFSNSYWTGRNTYGAPPAINDYVNYGVGVDVNHDGDYNDAFSAGTHNLAMNEHLERKRSGVSASFQANFGNAWQLTADYFFSQLLDIQRDRGVLMASTGWGAGNWVPLVSRDTGDHIAGTGNNGGADLVYNTTQKYKKWVGEFSPFTQVYRNESHSRNFNVSLAFDNGGQFSGRLRLVSDSADALSNNAYVQFSDTDGALWPNAGLTPGKMYVPTSDAASGVVTFNPNGHAPAEVPMTFDMRGGMSIGMPASMRTFIQDPDNFRVKTIENGQNAAYQRDAGINVVRFDGSYDFRTLSNLKLDFGARNSVRTASNQQYQMVFPISGAVVNGQNGKCYVRYLASDVILKPNASGTGCVATNGTPGQYIHANTYAGTPLTGMPAAISDNLKMYHDFAGVDITTFGLDPKALDHPNDFVAKLWPGNKRDYDPSQSWDLVDHTTSGYVQLNFAEGAVRGNVGLRMVHTALSVNHHNIGASCCTPGMNPVDLGKVNTTRSFTDYLPAMNLSVDLAQDWKLRFAYSRNMMPLSLDQWGGGYAPSYAYDNGENRFKTTGGTENGNVNLDPWRSRNVSVALEYYGEHTTLSLNAFDIAVASYVQYDTNNICDQADLDGVVRRCVNINVLSQGAGAELHGLALGVQQRFDFLPGIWGNFGVNANYTFSPSSVGTDIAGNTIPFQDNSKNQANVILWYEDNSLQVRLAANYRSKRAIAQNHNGVQGFELYQAPITYVDASVEYKLTKHFSVFLNGRNLTGAAPEQYLVYSDQVYQNYRYDTRYTLGVRVNY